MKKLNVMRFEQIDSMGCVVASLASVLTYHNVPNSSYEDVEKSFFIDREKGISAPDLVLYLGNLGFSCEIIGLQFSAFTLYEAQHFSQQDIELRLKEFTTAENISSFAANAARQYLNTLNLGHKYTLKPPTIDILKTQIDKGNPVIIGIQPRVYSQKPVKAKDYLPSHAIVVHGYDDNGFFVIDSDKGKGHEDLEYLTNYEMHLALTVSMNGSLGDEGIIIIEKKKL